MSTINKISQIKNYSTGMEKTNQKGDSAVNKENTTPNAETQKAVSQDTFALKSTETFGGYTAEVATATSAEVAADVFAEVAEEKEEATSPTITSSSTSGGKTSVVDIDDLKNQQLVNYQNMIQRMLHGQSEEGSQPTRVDAIAKAQASLEGDGYWSPESVSTRIMDMAKSLSGGDPEMFEVLKEAVIKGFGAAADEWGDELPDITNTTYDLVMQKFDSWYQELNPTVAE